MAEVFVFGSNLAGRHGKGTAFEAFKKHGAIYGQGIGRQGNSYAIPTKDGRNGRNLSHPSATLSRAAIQVHVRFFLKYAEEHPEDIFNVTLIGCGHAGYKPFDIGPMFKGHPDNVKLPKEFLPFI